MEPDSARKENVPLDDLDLDYDLLSRLIHDGTIEAFAKEIAGNISNEIRELGMLGASNPPPMDKNVAASANANILDATEENIQHLAQPAGSFSSPPSTTIAQIDPPIMQPESQSPAAGNNQRQDLLNCNSSTFGNEQIISIKMPDPLVTNATNFPEPSFGTPVTGTPKPSSSTRPEAIGNSGNQFHLQPSNNPQDHLERGILGGSESFPTHGNPNHQGHVLSSYAAFDPPVGNSTNVGQTMASSYSCVLPTLTEAYPPPPTGGLMQQNDTVRPTFPSQSDGNWLNAPNVQSQNSFEIDFVTPQWMAPSFADQSGQNMANNNMTGNNIRQAPVYSAQYPQTILGTGVIDGRTSSWLNPQQQTSLPVNNFSPYRHLPPSGQVMTSSVFNPPNANSMLYRPSMPLRTQNLVNGLPLHNQIHGMSNMYAPPYNNHSVALGQPMQQWPQQCTNQNYQDHMVSNVYNPQGFNASLPGSSSLALRTPNLSHGTHGVLNFQYPSSSLAAPNSITSTSMTQQLNRNYQSIQRMPSLLNLQTRHSRPHNLSGQLGQVNLMNFGGPIVINPQNSSSIQPASSMLPGTQISSAQGRTNRTSAMPGLAALQTENFVLPGQKAQGPQEAPNVSTTNWPNTILDSSQESELVNTNTNPQETGNQEEGVIVSDQLNRNQERRSKTQNADTSSSSSSKRPKRKRESATQDDMQYFDFPANDGTSNVANARKPRWEKNGVYSPSFERAGLHIDPHLRMFSLQ